MSLLMLATLLVYAAPIHAGLMPHHHSAVPHEHVLADAHAHAVAGAADHEHESDPCKDLGLLDDGACCSAAQCVTMHGGLPAVSFEAYTPHLDTSVHVAVHVTPEGIDVDPALRPPCLTV